MVIIMEMGTGRADREDPGCYREAYGDEVLNASWAEVPRVEARLAEVAASRHGEALKTDIEGFMARLYASQE